MVGGGGEGEMWRRGAEGGSDLGTPEQVRAKYKEIQLYTLHQLYNVYDIHTM